MSKTLALQYAEKVNKVNKGVIDAFVAGYKQKESEYENQNISFHVRNIKSIILKEIEDKKAEIENIKLGIGYSDLRGSAYEREKKKIDNLYDSIKTIQQKIDIINSNFGY